MKFHIIGTLNFQCDRCLGNLDHPLNIDEDLFVKFGEDENSQSEDLVYINPNEHEIEISQYIYEFIKLNIPIRKVHPDDKKGNSLCNKEMLERIEELEDNKTNKEIDSRWNKLKEITKK